MAQEPQKLSNIKRERKMNENPFRFNGLTTTMPNGADHRAAAVSVKPLTKSLSATLTRDGSDSARPKRTSSTNIYFQNFDSTVNGITTTGSWHIGAPTAGPSSAYSGSNCAGTNYNSTGFYEPNASDTLYLPSIALPSVSTSGNLWLTFFQYGYVEAGFDYVSVIVSANNGSSWTIIDSQTGSLGSSWTERDLSIKAYAGETVRIAFVLNSDDVVEFAGWYVDDISVWSPAPFMPTLASPANNAANQPTTLALKVNAVDGASGYHWQVSTDLAFSTPVVDDSISGLGDTAQIVMLTSGTKYYWRVQAFDGSGGAGEYAGPDSFTTLAVPSSPALVSPADGATNQSTVSTLKINPIGGASGYHWQISQNSAFTAIMVDDSVSGSDDTLKVIVLNPNATYYWRVQSFNNGGLSAYTSTYSFTTGSDVTLAVQATDFVATAAVGSVRLSWKTQSETENAGFNILRADSGTTFFTLVASYASNDSLRGLGTSTAGRSYDFTDNKVTSGMTYKYRVQTVSTDGVKQDLTTLFIKVDVPKTYALYQNYPNPFNPSTIINYQLPMNSQVTLKVYDVLGREVATLVDGQQNAGVYKANFDGSRFASGVYFYRITATDNNGQRFTAIRKLMLVK
jgi:hypothetical protein